jgi:CMP-N-acetylneuraminic acid synthetase
MNRMSRVLNLACVTSRSGSDRCICQNANRLASIPLHITIILNFIDS